MTLFQNKLEAMGITPEEANLERIPSSYKEVQGEVLDQNLRLIEALESDEDVIRVFHNILG